MNYLISYIIPLITIFLFSTIKAASAGGTEKINVLISKPDIEDPKNYLERYNAFVKQYVDKKRLESNDSIPSMDIEFSYCEPDPNDGIALFFAYKYSKDVERFVDLEFAKNLNCTLRELKKKGNENIYDMVVLPDRLLYSDDTYIHNAVIEGSFYIEHIHDYLLNYDHLISMEDIKHHNKVILERARHKGKELLGLPYELDFDNLYYYNEDEDKKNEFLTDSILFQKNIINNTQKDDEKKKLPHTSNGTLSIALGDEDELINLFFEYVRIHLFESSHPEDTSYLDKFYNDKNKIMEFYRSFREFVLKYTGSDVRNTLSTTPQQAFQSFIQKDKKLFKGKASYYSLLKKNVTDSISMANLPKDYGVVEGKYLSILNYSHKLPNHADDILYYALLLTSEDFQLARATEFGSIPTVNLNVSKMTTPHTPKPTPTSTSTSTHPYCLDNQSICRVFSRTKPIEVKKVFQKNKYSASFLEIRIILPIILQKLISEEAYQPIYEKIPNFINTGELVKAEEKTSPKEIILLITFGVTSLAVIFFLLYIMIMVYKNRKHPYLKAISPQLSNITLLGLILKSLFPFYFWMIRNETLCQLNFVFNFFFSNLIYLPMVAIIYRIYYIYTNVSNVNFGKKLNDRRMIRKIIIALISVFIISFIASFYGRFGFTTFGAFEPYRIIWCYFYNFIFYLAILLIYSTILFIFMIIMVIKIHKLSKKYGDIKFIFFIVVLLFTTTIFDSSIYLLLGIDSLYVVLYGIYLFSCIVSTYLLVGYRLIYIKKHPIKDGSFNGNSVDDGHFDNAINLVNFIPLMKDKNNRTFSFFNRSKHDLNSHGTFVIFQDDDNDSIEKNPNNYFFNRTLRILNQQKQKRASV
ncbi:hypothetical protein H8356DRAFT_1736773 [Neocallimastix lanati (nom. inval.)]|nr:hypothetical protein H8356DRAFT_1736773 [Neocallimastix sp. JGI-2020a]